MILLIDNYDSFTYNLYQYLSEYDEVKVIRNDVFTIDELRETEPDLIVLSPGPGHPDEAGMCIETIQEFGSTVPIIGICLGHQAIGAAYGADVIRAKNIMHAKESLIEQTRPDIFGEGSRKVMRYHSLVIDQQTLPGCLEPIAYSADDGEIMAVLHKTHPVLGLQFHPESIGTDEGKKILKQCTEFIRAKERV
ncbi:anthranilate synthase component II [Jeotgalibacillus haloalkalitolerans]|uniref:Aminodeoxychorismate/anthranilate synthase component II n=1 Tax=Jeotgalibacillus haloalkalitolerans TaxID=3104292 RepID=A0ABU5KKX5_9BACL|nr:aminodeoxychorismate/anthranilate synthase component II [Jeotgalibacillus sp. HH7-29]MDZ5711912.1 aminodeoxychorismate/anthranilate synthase component II [Jeotgalibacillus sp. HH7-29]